MDRYMPKTCQVDDRLKIVIRPDLSVLGKMRVQNVNLCRALFQKHLNVLNIHILTTYEICLHWMKQKITKIL